MNPKDFAVNFLITKDRCEEFLFSLEKLSEIRDEKKLYLQISKNFLPEEVKFLKEFLQKAKEKNEAVEKIKKELLEIPVFKLILPFSPSSSFILKIASLLKSKGEIFLIKVEKDPSLLAGAIIEYKGKFWDFSLKKFLKEKGEL